RAGPSWLGAPRPWRGAAWALPGPGIAQRDRAVEHRRAGGVVAAVGDEVAGALELEGCFRRGGRGGRLDIAGDELARFRVQVVAVGFAFGFIVRVLDREKAIVQADLGRHRMGGTDPVDGALDLAV